MLYRHFATQPRSFGRGHQAGADAKASAQFSEPYGVNREWLLAGTGRIFKTDPIAINPNITGSEFASAVRTLPVAERRLIEAKLGEMARIRTS